MRLLFSLFFCVALLPACFAQTPPPADTLRLSLAQADSVFRQHNLLLLAGRFQVEASRAEALQASLTANPTLTVEASAYNNETRRVVDVGRQGQKVISIEQLLATAGKRNKRVALAAQRTRLTELELLDLLRGLRYELRTRFYAIYFDQQTLQRFDQQRAMLQTTVAAYQTQYDRNNVSLRELLRLRTLLFQLDNDRATLLGQLAENQQALQTLLSTDRAVRPLTTDAELARYTLPALPDDTLRQLALRNRPDVLVKNAETEEARLNYTLQRALAVPDLQVGARYDQASDYIRNYVGVSLSADIPLFNRNQGAIRAARSQIAYQQQLAQQQAIQVRNEVSTALQQVRAVEARVQAVESTFTSQLEQLNQGVITSFRRGNLTLIEFVDLVEAYTDSIQQLNRLKADRVGAYESLSYRIGRDLFN